MPPLYHITFISHNAEITFSLWCSKQDLGRKGLEKLIDTVRFPMDFKIKL
jgi:hypothetical protein